MTSIKEERVVGPKTNLCRLIAKFQRSKHSLCQKSNYVSLGNASKYKLHSSMLQSQQINNKHQTFRKSCRNEELQG